MMNWENVKRILSEGTMESAEKNAKLLNEIAELKTEIADTECTLISLQDLMRQAQMHKEELERKCAVLEAEYSQKKSISNNIAKMFKTEKTVDTSVEPIDSGVSKFSQKVSSTLSKMRYDLSKGAISEDDFKQGLETLRDSIDEELNDM